MKCSTARKWISDYLDGELKAEEERKIEAHLKACVGCQEFLEDLKAITGAAKGLPMVEPSAAAWRRIATGMEKTSREQASRREKRSSWAPWLWPSPVLRYALASLMALVIVGGLVIGLKPWRGWLPPQEKSLDYTVAKLKEAQRYYEKAIASLEEAVKAQGNGLNPELTEVFQTNLEAMDETIRACQQMVKGDPDNVVVRTYLLGAYRDKVNFLEEYMGIKKASSEKRKGTTI